MQGNTWVMYPRPARLARLRLFCFPYAGGSASIFGSWPQHLPPTIEICPIQLPGREKRLDEPPIAKMADLVEVLAHALLPHLNKPFAFFGHCLGALISFELAHYLRSQGYGEPLRLIVSASRAPEMRLSHAPIHTQPDAAFVADLRRLKGTPEEVLQNKTLMQALLPALRADYALDETFVYEERASLCCPIIAYGGLQDREINREHIVAWQHHTSSSFTHRMFPGDHFFLDNDRTRLLRMLSQDLLRE